MEKLQTTTRYAENYDGLHIEADVVKNEKENKVTSVNGGMASDPEKGINAWFSIDSAGHLNIGNVKVEDSDVLNAVTDAVVSFYKEVSVL